MRACTIPISSLRTPPEAAGGVHGTGFPLRRADFSTSPVVLAACEGQGPISRMSGVNNAKHVKILQGTLHAPPGL